MRLLVLDEAGRWLLLRTARDHTRWQLPGGRIRLGESPAITSTKTPLLDATGLCGPRDAKQAQALFGEPGPCSATLGIQTAPQFPRTENNLRYLYRRPAGRYPGTDRGPSN
ncbi:NUDIX hydrolase [Streptosporangium amethystogenes]|uniref:NUDIX hydrolase n=1 Tax=Streptosporangium amethystogenes TaxID=2002 RepID=UPI0037A990BF